MDLAAVKGDKTFSELSQQFDVHPNQITQWKKQLLERMSEMFEGSNWNPLIEMGLAVQTSGTTSPILLIPNHSLNGKKQHAC